MGENSNIEWTDVTWNPLHGCSDASEGCRNCYAKREAHIHAKHPNPKVAARFEGLTRISGGKVCWTGKVNLHEDKLTEPLRWRKPRRVFVNSQSDLFHKDVPFDFIDKVFAVMALTPHITYMILTKRPERMAEYLAQVDLKRIMAAMEHQAWQKYGPVLISRKESWIAQNRITILDGFDWPLPNVWLGTSVEDQPTADERIRHLIRCPAAVRFLSMEPLLGDVDLRGHFSYPVEQQHTAQVSRDMALDAGEPSMEGMTIPWGTTTEWILHGHIHWVIVGGESGPGARPMHPDWARSIRDQCVAAGVPFFFKQWGAYKPIGTTEGKQVLPWGDYNPETGHGFIKTGKKAAGRLLDGQEWSQFPEREAVKK